MVSWGGMGEHLLGSGNRLARSGVRGELSDGDIPPEVVDQVLVCVVDLVGVAAAGPNDSVLAPRKDPAG
jgi:2-methylcitrate dehydratase PrpD